MKAGKATINGVSIADKAKALEIAQEDRRDARDQHRGGDQEGDREQGKGGVVDGAIATKTRKHEELPVLYQFVPSPCSWRPDRRGAAAGCGTVTAADTADPGGWSRFRGPNGSGISTSTRLPTEFGPEQATSSGRRRCRSGTRRRRSRAIGFS